jgi:hypothetical protein
MNLGQRQIAIAAGALIVIVVAVFWWFRTPANTPNAPEGTWRVCTNKTCGHTFNMSIKEISEHHEKHYGEPIPCPKCKSESMPAMKCKSCQKVSAMQRGQTKCPACGAAIAPPE